LKRSDLFRILQAEIGTVSEKQRKHGNTVGTKVNSSMASRESKLSASLMRAFACKRLSTIAN
jgi:hypothetical protein